MPEKKNKAGKGKASPKKPADKKQPAKKPVAKKQPAKKSADKNPPAKKPVARKQPPKKAEPKKTVAARKKPKKTKKQSMDMERNLYKGLFAIMVLISIVVVIGLYFKENVVPYSEQTADQQVQKPPKVSKKAQTRKHDTARKPDISEPEKSKPEKSKPGKPEPEAGKADTQESGTETRESPERKRITQRAEVPPYEVYSGDIDGGRRLTRPDPAVLQGRPVAAIIIDDIGFDLKMVKKFLSLDAKITFSILPNSPFRKKAAERAYANGNEIMLHLPMEPFEYPKVNPGKNALLTSMTPDELLIGLRKSLDEVPYAKGVNNHMGSKMTSVSTQMYQIFTILKKEGLFFVDSRTSMTTIARPSARLLKIPFGERDVFFDHVQDGEEIVKEIRHMITIAKDHGRAIGIGHPHRITFEMIKELLPEIKEQVDIVPASQIVEILG